MAIAAAALMALLLGVAAMLLTAEHEDSATFSGAVHARRQGQAAVLFSGDAGFLGAGPEIARTIEDLGLPVYGVSSLAEFRERRTIAQTVGIVNDAVRVARAKFDADRILLVGHSFGSDVIGAALPDLAPDVRRALIGAVLIVPTDSVYLRADPTELSYRGPPDATLSRVQSVNWLPMLCIQGQQEPDSLCPSLRASNVMVMALPGGHALHHDEAQLAAAINRGVTPMLGSGPR
jgi:type IV secretory pathway VirJ component